ncbi:DUF2254 domain-containing protein [Achromobacter mucicolens]|uniref:Uncharacterized protein n=1 Tax=Achromobacter aegrifaciens TaxID=1287736 RepID=A0AAD2J4V4_ACHAE|nr:MULTISPECIES: hypothetical protein [Achromobacter]MDG9969810.1 DUF2254 domain-containing protein [Achromobacter mucicolens]CAB3893966.1 hypothetical protein LMG26684_04245 [Achromobacter mucicolens]CUJ70863.1 Uncharacterised protein [Achromobacter aegrifaciens]
MTTTKQTEHGDDQIEQELPATEKRRRGLAVRTVVRTAKVVGRPYIELGKSVKRLRGTLRTLGQSLASPASGPDSNFVDAPNAADAFERLYEANGWTEPALMNQRKAVVRSKFASLVLAIVFLAVSVYGVLSLRYVAYVPIAMIFIGLAVTAMGLALFIQYAINQAQIDERRLYSAHEFFSHPNRWVFLFSS